MHENRISYLHSLTSGSMHDDLEEREEWEKKPVLAGDIYYVKISLFSCNFDLKTRIICRKNYIKFE